MTHDAVETAREVPKEQTAVKSTDQPHDFHVLIGVLNSPSSRVHEFTGSRIEASHGFVSIFVSKLTCRSIMSFGACTSMALSM